MTRADANLIVRQRVHYVNDIKGVPLAMARAILGDDQYERMMADKIRCQGPVAGYVYPWNVVDYLTSGPAAQLRGEG